ncbi:MAG: hypothetical protein V3V04_01850 [Rhizobiaceae bacterium]
MREINISTEVFAAIWANRDDGEESENEILQRLLLPNTSINKTKTVNSSITTNGVHDHRNGVHFPEGMQIHRDYKGQKYTAIANSGQWLRQDTQQKFSTLNQLNTSIAAGVENVWNGNWRFLEEDTTKSIDVLRKRAHSV